MKISSKKKKAEKVEITVSWKISMLKDYIDYIDELILIRWNRVYPADFILRLIWVEWNLVNKEEFIESSHEKITWEDYVR